MRVEKPHENKMEAQKKSNHENKERSSNNFEKHVGKSEEKGRSRKNDCSQERK